MLDRTPGKYKLLWISCFGTCFGLWIWFFQFNVELNSFGWIRLKALWNSRAYSWISGTFWDERNSARTHINFHKTKSGTRKLQTNHIRLLSIKDKGNMSLTGQAVAKNKKINKINTKVWSQNKMKIKIWDIVRSFFQSQGLFIDPRAFMRSEKELLLIFIKQSLDKGIFR